MEEAVAVEVSEGLAPFSLSAVWVAAALVPVLEAGLVLELVLALTVVVLLADVAAVDVVDDDDEVVAVGTDDGPNTMGPELRSWPRMLKDGLLAPKPATNPGRRLNQQGPAEVRLSSMGNVALYAGALFLKAVRCRRVSRCNVIDKGGRVSTLVDFAIPTAAPEIQVRCWERARVCHIDRVHLVVYLIFRGVNEYHSMIWVVVLRSNGRGHQDARKQKLQPGNHAAWL